MEERRDKEYIIEVTADKEQQQQAILRIAIATGIETERIENCIAKLESLPNPNGRAQYLRGYQRTHSRRYPRLLLPREAGG